MVRIETLVSLHFPAVKPVGLRCPGTPTRTQATRKQQICSSRSQRRTTRASAGNLICVWACEANSAGRFSLTDEETRENYEKYGNPVGRARSFAPIAADLTMGLAGGRTAGKP